MTSLQESERADLSELFDRLGPDAPTLCEGWQTRDLAAHLVLREGRYDAAPGIVVKFLSGWTNHVQGRLAHSDYRALVNRFRGGPPKWSLPYRLPKLGEAMNNVELFVHHEDVRRAQPQWEPRTLDSATNDLLWNRGRKMARLSLRSEDDGVELVRSDTRERHTAKEAKAGAGVRTVTGPPQELMLYLFGRREHALVETTDAAA